VFTDESKKDWFDRSGYGDCNYQFEKMSASDILNLEQGDLERYFGIGGVAIYLQGFASD
jgi:hypothetical protein